jgi:hypothetical protein
MREPTVHALGSVRESKKAKTQTMERLETIRLWPSQRDFFSASYGKCTSRSKIEPAAAATTMAHSSTSLRSDSDRHHPEGVIEIKSESVITFRRNTQATKIAL